MSWSFSFTGKKPAVLKAIEGCYQYPKEGDQTSILRAKIAISAMLVATPDSAAIKVSASGHSDNAPGNPDAVEQPPVLHIEGIYDFVE